MTLQTPDYDVWADVADAYRKFAKWPGRKNADPKLLVEAMIAVEDVLRSHETSQNKPREFHSGRSDAFWRPRCTRESI